MSLVSFPFTKPGDLAIRVTGDSMVPRFHSGDLIAIRPAPHWFRWLSLGEPYIVQTEYNVMLKLVKTGRKDAENNYSLHSVNPDYEPFDVPKKDIKNVFSVLGSMSQYHM